MASIKIDRIFDPFHQSCYKLVTGMKYPEVLVIRALGMLKEITEDSLQILKRKLGMNRYREVFRQEIEEFPTRGWRSYLLIQDDKIPEDLGIAIKEEEYVENVRRRRRKRNG